jgi:hypothetical protein
MLPVEMVVCGKAGVWNAKTTNKTVATKENACVARMRRVFCMGQFLLVHELFEK